MTTTHEAARADLTPVRRKIPQAWTDRWFKEWAPHVRVANLSPATMKPGLTGQEAIWFIIDELAGAGKFEPRAPISALAGRLLNASNAIYPTKRILP